MLLVYKTQLTDEYSINCSHSKCSYKKSDEYIFFHFDSLKPRLTLSNKKTINSLFLFTDHLLFLFAYHNGNLSIFYTLSKVANEYHETTIDKISPMNTCICVCWLLFCIEYDIVFMITRIATYF